MGMLGRPSCGSRHQPDEAAAAAAAAAADEEAAEPPAAAAPAAKHMPCQAACLRLSVMMGEDHAQRRQASTLHNTVPAFLREPAAQHDCKAVTN